MIHGDSFWARHFPTWGIVAAIGYWLVESYCDSYIEGVDGFGQAIFTPPWHELWTRIVIAVFFVLVGFFIGRLIRRRQATEEKLEKSLEETKFFAYSVSHDLKSPSVSLYGLARRLKTSCADMLDKKGREYCRLIENCAEQIVGLVDTINGFISAREMRLNPELVRLKEIFATIRDEFYTELETKNIKLNCPDTEVSIIADRLSLIRALRNLTGNSLKHGKNVKEICISYEDRADFHLLSVEDDGDGVNAADQEKIFEPFVRGKSAKGAAGMGLGLAIVKDIAFKQGGEVWLEPGKKRGVKFSLSIPKQPPS